MQRSNNNKQTKSHRPISFEWIYHCQPEPGLRKWHREGNVWKEIYPSGLVTVFNNVSPSDEKDGSVVTKDDGAQVFIPSINEKNIGDEWQIYWRSSKNNNWQSLGPITNIKLRSSTCGKREFREQNDRPAARHRVVSDPETDLAPIVKEVTPFLPSFFRWAIESHNARKAKSEIDIQKAQLELQNKKEMLEQAKLNKVQEGRPQHKNEEQETEQPDVKEIRKNSVNLQQNIQKYTDFLDVLDLTTYRNYEDCERQIREVRQYDMSRELKKNLFDKIRNKQQLLQKNLPVLTESKPRLFDKAHNETVDEAKNIAMFKERLNILRIDTPQEYEAFKDDDFYTHCGLTEYTKDRLFHVHQENNKKNAAFASLHVGTTLSMDNNNKDDFLPRL